MRKPQRMAWLLFDDGIQWAVLGILRPDYSLREAGVVSKVEAGGYAPGRLTKRWHKLIEEGIRLR